MWFIGNTFYSDENSLNPTIAISKGLNKIALENAIFDEFHITSDVLQVYSTTRDDWGYKTILLSKFQNNLNAGNIDFANTTVLKMRLKRRKIEDLANWWTIAEFDFSINLNFEYFDYINEADQEYEYALVAVGENNLEGSYMTSTIYSEFNAAYITDGKNIYKLAHELNYDNVERNTKTQVFEPLDSKYPIVLKQAETNYDSGNMSALILSDKTENDFDNIDKKQEVIHRKKLIDFLTNGESKFIKDSNGNAWLVYIVGKPSITFRNEVRQQIADVSMGGWVEIGDYNKKEDMYDNNLLYSLD